MRTTSISFALTVKYGLGTRGGCSSQASPLALFLPLLALSFTLGGRSFPVRSSASLPLCGLCFGARVWAGNCAEKTVKRMVGSTSKGSLMRINVMSHIYLPLIAFGYANGKRNDDDLLPCNPHECGLRARAMTGFQHKNLGASKNPRMREMICTDRFDLTSPFAFVTRFFEHS